MNSMPMNFQQHSRQARIGLIIFAICALLGPNGLYLYFAILQPELTQVAMQNPIALAFMIEAMMLLLLFLWYVLKITDSWKSVMVYLLLSLLGSLAFSFPLFLYRQSGK